MKKTRELATELANVIKYNPELLDSFDLLSLMIECRLTIWLREAFEAGKQAVLVNDLSSLDLEVRKGAN